MHNKNINTEIFAQLLKDAKFINQGKECFGFECKHNNYEISFSLVDYAIIVEDFGCMQNGKWLQAEPTIEQMAIMTEKLRAIMARARSSIFKT